MSFETGFICPGLIVTAEVTREGRLNPSVEFPTEDGYRWFVYPPEVTGLTLVSLEDQRTGVVMSTIHPNPEVRTSSFTAWSGARHSRAPGEPGEILAEIHELGVDPDEKLKRVWKAGHSAVGDMASEMVHITGVPMHFCMTLFNTGAVNSGQEKSTRYQETFGEAVLQPLALYLPEGLSQEEVAAVDGEYQALGGLSRELFAQHLGPIVEVFTEHFEPQDEGEERSLHSRALDCVRFFLLAGQGSGLSYETSVRDWSRIIGELKASPLAFYQQTAMQMERLLAPSAHEEDRLGVKAGAPGLIRHTEPAVTTAHNLQGLKEYVESETSLLTDVEVADGFQGEVEQGVDFLPDEYTTGERMVAQYLLALWPGLDRSQLLDWVARRDEADKRAISDLVFKDHDHHLELPQIARTTNMTLVFEASLGEVRDLNRHRAWGRFIPLPLSFGLPVDYDTSQQILSKGYGLPLYLTDMPELGGIRDGFSGDLNMYYEELYRFVGEMRRQFGDEIDYGFVLNLLTLAHRVDLWMHGDPKQGLYMPHLRSGIGGHINYRDLAWLASQQMASRDPYLSGMRLLRRPDPSNREEFFGRS